MAVDIGTFLESTKNLIAYFFEGVNVIGDWGRTIINLLLSVINYQIPDNIAIFSLNINTAAFFNIMIIALVVFIILRNGGKIVTDYAKYIIIITIIIIALSLLGGVLNG